MALEHPHFNPVALQIGPLAIHWYGLTYMVAFGLFVWLAGRRSQYPWFAREGWVRRDVEDMLFYGVLGVVLGGRLGYVLFYKPAYYASHLTEIPAVWKGGMSFHGGMLGVIVAMALFGWHRKRPFLQVTDLIAPCVPLGLASGRVGNFINGELWGRPADPSAAVGDDLPRVGLARAAPPVADLPVPRRGRAAVRHPVIFGRKERGRGQVSGLFLMGYGVLRFTAEFFREPDDFLGLLSLGMIWASGCACRWWWPARSCSGGARSSRAGRRRPRPERYRGRIPRGAARHTCDNRPMRQIFLDTETTGLSPDSGDRMVEIGCIEMDNRRLTGRHLHFYLNPERKNGEGAVAVHGLTDEFLSDKPLFAHVVDEIIEFVSGAEIIIHNAGFDVGFLNEELRRCGREKFPTHVAGITDTLLMAREMFPGKANSLDALCKRLEVDNSNRTTRTAR